MDNLITTPDVTGLPNLERFDILSCSNLKEIHSSTGRSESLVYLRILYCENLVKVPPISGSKKLATLFIEHNPKLFDKEIHVDEIGREELASDKHSGTNRFVSYLTSWRSNLGRYTQLKNHPDKAEFDVQFSSGDPSLPRNISYISTNKTLTNLNLRFCRLGADDFDSIVWELPNLQQLDLSGNLFSHIDFSLLKLPRLKYLMVSYCLLLKKLLELPSSIAVLIADRCGSLGSIGDISKCKWLWKVSLVHWVKSPSSTVIKIPDISEGNAIEDHFISLGFPTNQLKMKFVDRVVMGGELFALQLPPNWYDDSCGFFICVDSNDCRPCFTIILKPEMGKDFQFEDGQQESNIAWRPDDCCNTYVGYVSLKMLKRHIQAPWWNSAYNIASFSIIVDDGCDDVTAFGAKLVLRKSKGHGVQTAKAASDYSEFWDEEYVDINTFTIQHDSNSSIKIVWTTCGPRTRKVK